MLIDNVAITVKAGNGGDGTASFSHIKMTQGPTGASGGNGGDAYLEAVADIGALRRFRAKKVFAAENGKNGRSGFRDGERGGDLVLLVPRGTVVRNLTSPPAPTAPSGPVGRTSNKEVELTRIGERILVAAGGRGGKGNYHFRSPKNTTPKQFQYGVSGEECRLQLELKLIADIGLVGLPNIGKSSFLNEVTNASSPVANYAFTTLEPYLGVYYDLVLADIPGLIAGASSGRGLGIKFLRHIERTKIIFHFIDAGSKHPLRDYRNIRKELGAYSPELLKKQEYIVISKSDTATDARVKEIKKIFAPYGKGRMAISIYNYDQMASARKLLDLLSNRNHARI